MKRILMFFVLISVCLLPSSASCWSGLFDGSVEKNYVVKNLEGLDWDLAMDVMKNYFKDVNGSISSKRAKNYAIYVKRAASDYSVDPFLIASVMISSSDLMWTKKLNGRYGLMMIDWGKNRSWIDENHGQVDSIRELFKPAKNIRIGSHLIDDRLRKSAGDYDELLLRFYSEEDLSFRDRCFPHYRNMVRLYVKEKGEILRSYGNGDWKSKWDTLVKQRQ